MPSINAVGTNTLESTSTIAINAPCTCVIAFFVASFASKPSRMFRSTFSTTTIASSTTMPIASTKPNSDKLLMENPKNDIIANVPMSDTGIANSGITAARQFCKNTIMTMTTSMIASYIVW